MNVQMSTNCCGVFGLEHLGKCNSSEWNTLGSVLAHLGKCNGILCSFAKKGKKGAGFHLYCLVQGGKLECIDLRMAP